MKHERALWMKYVEIFAVRMQTQLVLHRESKEPGGMLVTDERRLPQMPNAAFAKSGYLELR